ncbi:hypothetical protein LPJ81_007115 [Coemansia sp. IMI 209127]|nr:hypothetical protein LPJ81_007115 [Coemansia sp. IMI 209127]
MGAPPSAPSTGGGYGGPRGNMHGGYGHHQQQQPVGGGYGGGYGYGAEPMDVGSDQKPSQWGQQQPQQHQQQYYGASGGNSAPAYGGYQQPQQQQQQAGGEQAMQWTNKQTADYYAQYASTNPEYAQYADYYRKLAETDPNGIVPSGEARSMDEERE